MLRSIVFGYLVIVGFVTARIDVTVSKTRYNVQAGDDVTLDCSISSYPGPLDSVFWTKGGRTVYSSSDRDTKKYSGSSISDPSLTIHGTTTSDSGYYYCKGRKGSSTGSDRIQLRVTQVIVPETTYSVLAGTSVTLQCSISPTRSQTTVYWTKAGRSRQVYSSDSPRNRKYYIPRYTDQSLTISDTVIEDTGSYTCQVLLSRGGYSSSPINVTSSPVNLTVYKQFMVSIRPSSTDITVPEGSQVTARTCESDDCPPDCVTEWILPNGEQTTSDILSQPVTREQAGKYTCTASIGDISKSESLYVTVNYKQFTASIRPISTDIIVQEGNHVTARTCESDDCPPGCVKQWILPNGDRRTSDIFTRPVTREQAGEYTCTASIGDISKSESFYVTVNYGPRNISLSPPGDVSVQEGERIDVRCQASCSPPCDIYWTGPNTYQAGRRGPDLLIRQADNTDRGVYVCMASNDYGNISTSLRVTVTYGPKEIVLEPTARSYTMLEGDTMQNVLCKADCNPACHVTWTTNNDRVSGNGTLSLGRLDTSRDGTYTCTARGGTRTRTVTINVTTLYGPKTISLSPPGDVSVQEKEGIDVRCQANCSPSCAIYWTGPTTTYQAGRRGPNLLIRHADKTDRGVYVCVASNDYGNISTSVRVNVNYEECTESVPVIGGLASVAALFLVTSIAFFVNVLRKRIAAKRQIQEEHYCSIDPAGQEVPNTYEMIVTDRTPP